MRISLLHPSRNRPIKCFEAAHYWLSKASGKPQFEYIISVDEDESMITEYLDLLKKAAIAFPKVNFTFMSWSNGYVVDATNNAAKGATGDIFVFVADDFRCPQNWDDLIVQRIGHLPKSALMVDDCCQKNNNLLTLPIITKAVYDELGYFFHPEFKSMFCDNYIYEQVKRAGYLIEALDLKFPHHHFSNVNVELRSEPDEVYFRSNNLYDSGRQIFNRLSEQNGWDLKY